MTYGWKGVQAYRNMLNIQSTRPIVIEKAGWKLFVEPQRILVEQTNNGSDPVFSLGLPYPFIYS
jgi:hypothetical protein